MFKNSLIYSLFCKIHKLLWPGLYKVQSFTFYIPAPPSRKNGYREKEFDTIFYNFINQGYDILDTNTQTNSSKLQSGIWVMFTVKAKTIAASKLNLNDDFLNNLKLDDGASEKVEGLYTIENEYEEYDNIDY